MDKQSRPLPTIAVYSLTGCAGELLVILENMHQLLPLVKVVAFPFAQSRNEMRPTDIAFIEGSVSSPHDLEKLKQIRANARWLVALGNCAVWGCVQKSGCRTEHAQDMVKQVYGQDSPIRALNSEPLDKYVTVDVKLSGCPINADQLLPVVASLLKDHLPYITHKPVCLECKLRGNPCVLIEKNLPCLGPITASGCGALCPTVGAACYGCWGPCDSPQVEAMATILTEKGYELPAVVERMGAYGMPYEVLERVEKLKAVVKNK